MAKKDITPFSEELKNDIIETLRYIQNHKDEEAKLKAEREEAQQWLQETLGVNPDEEGTVHFGDPDNFVTFEVRKSYTVDADKVQELVETNQVSTETVDKVIEWKAGLSVANYKKLDDQTRAILSQAVTSKTGKPTLKINISEEK